MSTPHEVALSELAQGQAYFREHLSHAHAELEAFRTRQEIDAATIADLRKTLASAQSAAKESARERRQIEHDLAVHLRWQTLQQCGIDVFGMESTDHALAGANDRLGRIADVGEARLREDSEWAKAAEVASRP